MPAVYRYRLKVTAAAIDAQGHVNNLEYMRWILDAAVAHSVAQGWPAERYQQAGADWVVRSHWIEYLSPAFAGDDIVVLTWVANFRKVRSLRKYKIMRSSDEALLARAETDWSYIGFARRVPRRIPPELADSFEVVAADDEHILLRK